MTGRRTGPVRLLGTDVLAGALFMGIGVIGLYLARSYDMGTAARMGTGYVPRLVCWVLLGLGAVIALKGLRAADDEASDPVPLRPLVLIPASILAFGLTIEGLGLVLSAAALIAIGALASRDTRPVETVAVAILLIVGSVVTFVWGLGLPIAVWPSS